MSTIRAMRRRLERLEAAGRSGTEFWVDAGDAFFAPGGQPVTEAEFRAATAGARCFSLVIDAPAETVERIEAIRRGNA